MVLLQDVAIARKDAPKQGCIYFPEAYQVFGARPLGGGQSDADCKLETTLREPIDKGKTI